MRGEPQRGRRGRDRSRPFRRVGDTARYQWEDTEGWEPGSHGSHLYPSNGQLPEWKWAGATLGTVAVNPVAA